MPGLHGKPLGWHGPLTYPNLHWIIGPLQAVPESRGGRHSSFGLQQSTLTEINPSMNMAFSKILISNFVFDNKWPCFGFLIDNNFQFRILWPQSQVTYRYCNKDSNF